MNLDLPVQIASVQTLANRIDVVPKPDLLICDECHHIAAKTYQRIIDKFSDAFLLGVTATPIRMGGITLADTFNAMVESVSVNQLIELGNLTRFRYIAPKNDIDLSNVRVHCGEFNSDDLARVVNKPAITGNIVREFSRHARDKSAICYCVNIEHSVEVATAFSQAGFTAVHVDANTPAHARNLIVDEFRRGNIQILCNVDLFGEGFDVPNTQAAILARPTQSLSLFIQQALRPLRPDPNNPDKVAIIIDHVKNHKRHGLPNINRRWSLDPNVKRTPSEPPEEMRPGYHPRRRDVGEGDLEEIPVDFSPNQPADKIKTAPRTVEDFAAIAKERNYKVGWVAIKALMFARTFGDVLHIANVCGYKTGWARHKWLERKKKFLD